MLVGAGQETGFRARLKITPVAAVLGAAGWLGVLSLHFDAHSRTASLWSILAHFTIDWQLMVVAMMVPSMFPWLHLNARGHARNEAPVLAGFLSVWAVAGICSGVALFSFDVL